MTAPPWMLPCHLYHSVHLSLTLSDTGCTSVLTKALGRRGENKLPVKEMEDFKKTENTLFFSCNFKKKDVICLHVISWDLSSNLLCRLMGFNFVKPLIKLLSHHLARPPPTASPHMQQVSGKSSLETDFGSYSEATANSDHEQHSVSTLSERTDYQCHIMYKNLNFTHTSYIGSLLSHSWLSAY